MLIGEIKGTVLRQGTTKKGKQKVGYSPARLTRANSRNLFIFIRVITLYFFACLRRKSPRR